MITSTQLTDGTDTTLYPSTGTNAVTVMIFCNTATPNSLDETVNAVALELHVVSSGSISDANCIVKNLVVPAGETIFFDTERLVLDDGDYISGKLVTQNGTGVLTATVSSLSV
jgi:hypothetical protein